MRHLPPLLLRNPHLHTIWANTTRRINPKPFQRSRMTTSDGDFLDLDWRQQGSDALVILSHGLEGHSQRPYILGMAKRLGKAGFDTLAWNYRGCSGEPNALPRLYHCGCTYDLDEVIAHALSVHPYREVHLIGFSMGGVMTMLYLGQYRDKLPPQLKSFVAISAPCDLNDCMPRFEHGMGKVYAENFLLTLRQKIRAKAKQYPGQFDTIALSKVKTLRDFDNLYTAPIHGFDDAIDYWTKCTVRPLLPELNIPGIILNALDDPFLGGGCYPYDEVAQNPLLTMLTPEHGGHVGFIDTSTPYWSEHKALRFIQRHRAI